MSKTTTARTKATPAPAVEKKMTAAKPTPRRSAYPLIVANSPGPRKHSYEELLAKYLALKANGKIKGSRIKRPSTQAVAPEAEQTMPPLSDIPLRGQFTAEQISRAIDKVKGRQPK